METLAQQNSMSRCDTADAKVNLTKIPHLVDLRFISRAAVIAFSVPEFSLSWIQNFEFQSKASAQHRSLSLESQNLSRNVFGTSVGWKAQILSVYRNIPPRAPKKLVKSIWILDIQTFFELCLSTYDCRRDIQQRGWSIQLRAKEVVLRKQSERKTRREKSSITWRSWRRRRRSSQALERWKKSGVWDVRTRRSQMLLQVGWSNGYTHLTGRRIWTTWRMILGWSTEEDQH